MAKTSGAEQSRESIRNAETDQSVRQERHDRRGVRALHNTRFTRQPLEELTKRTTSDKKRRENSFFRVDSQQTGSAKRAFRGGREPSLVCPGSASALHSTLQGSWGTQKIGKQDA